MVGFVPQLLGRATSVGAYVKRGEESGYIKISLRGDTEEETLVITRKINTHNKSEWLFNGNISPYYLKYYKSLDGHNQVSLDALARHEYILVHFLLKFPLLCN